jgi:hypothetical protein
MPRSVLVRTIRDLWFKIYLRRGTMEPPSTVRSDTDAQDSVNEVALPVLIVATHPKIYGHASSSLSYRTAAALPRSAHGVHRSDTARRSGDQNSTTKGSKRCEYKSEARRHTPTDDWAVIRPAHGRSRLYDGIGSTARNFVDGARPKSRATPRSALCSFMARSRGIAYLQTFVSVSAAAAAARIWWLAASVAEQFCATPSRVTRNSSQHMSAKWLMPRL